MPLDNMDCVTMADIARLAGVSQAAVSMALRNHTRVSRALRERVQALAQKHGYAPHPYLSSLMACRRNRQLLPGTCLAYIDGFPDESHFKLQFNTLQMLRGLKERAAEFGFAVERFSTADPALAKGRLDRVLKARGIRGVILGNCPELPFRIELDWPAYCVVAVSQYFQGQAVDRVMSDPWQITETAMTELAARGYRRMGLVLPAASNAIGGNRFSGAYLDGSQTRGLSEYIAPYFPETQDSAPCLNWIRKQRPDAIIYFGIDVVSILQGQKVRIPKDLGVVAIACSSQEPRIAGVNQNAREVGAALAERAANLIYTNALGIPRSPRTIFVDSTWQDGWSVRAHARKEAPLTGS